MTVINRILGGANAHSDFIKHSAYENDNRACQAAIRPHRKKSDLAGYIRLCSDIGASYQQGLAMAAALHGYTVKEFLSQRNNKKCFKCGVTGHFSKDCKKDSKINTKSKMPGLCPQCKRGYHWANECRSKRDANDKQLPPLQGNGNEASPRPPNPSKSLGQSVLFQQTTIHFRPL